MTLTDALIVAMTDMLESHRVLLDGSAQVRSVRLDVKIANDRTIRTGLLTPEIEVRPRASAGQYIF
jgi:hypothetical protein